MQLNCRVTSFRQWCEKENLYPKSVARNQKQRQYLDCSDSEYVYIEVGGLIADIDLSTG